MCTVHQSTVTMRSVYPTLVAVLAAGVVLAPPGAAEMSTGQFETVDLPFAGPLQGPTDKPSADIEFYTEWRHESGDAAVKVYGFWDGDGAGGTRGNVFRVRFCPTRVGRWTLTRTVSNNGLLDGAGEGTTIRCIESGRHGFWERDGYWFRRSDGTHQYMVGNVHYCLMTGDHALQDLARNKEYFNKLRFFLALHPSCPMPVKPFFSSTGQPSNDGRDACRPNPSYFRRADEIVQAAARDDFIIDMYLEGQQGAIRNDCYLRYTAARFGSYANVWLQLQVEWNEYMSASETRAIGTRLRSFLPYPTPLSTISTKDWSSGLNGPWCTHANIQGKVFGLKPSAEAIVSARRTAGGIIANNDDNGPNFQGFGGTTREMETERILGCLLGAGYSGTGHKTSSKVGQYWTGNFDPAVHTCSSDLKYLREVIDSRVHFWQMKPGEGTFTNAADAAWLGWAGQQYLFGSDRKRSDVGVKLPAGTWLVEQFDIVAKRRTTLSLSAQGDYAFSTPASVASITLFTRDGLREPTAVAVGRHESAQQITGTARPTNRLTGAGEGHAALIDVQGRVVWRGRLSNGAAGSGATAAGSYRLVLRSVGRVECSRIAVSP